MLAGPVSAAVTTRGSTRPWTIDSIYLFDARELHTQLQARNVKIGTATSVRNSLWQAAENYPRSNSAVLVLTQHQRADIQLFRSTGT